MAAHSDLAMPNRFTWVAFYAGNEGSLLYIATILAIMSAIAVWRAPEKFKDALPYTTAVLMLTLTFFLAVTAVMANPSCHWTATGSTPCSPTSACSFIRQP